MQKDGNLVLYQSGASVWQSHTGGQNCGSNQCVAVFQNDGNLVVYNGATALWTSNTYGNSGATLVFSTAAPNMEIWSANQSTLWASSSDFSAGTLRLVQPASVNLGSLTLAMQKDCNFVLYQSGNAIWQSHTGNNSNSNQCVATFQNDGNLVVYNGSTALWASNTGTNNSSPPSLVLSAASPNMEIWSANQSSLWASSSTFSAGTLRLVQGTSLNLGSLILAMQNDGNLVLYQGGIPLWASQTGGQTCNSNNPCVAAFQQDGNFVVYSGTQALWYSNTGNTGTTLTFSLQSPYVEVLGSNRSVIWSTICIISGYVGSGSSGMAGVTVMLQGTTLAGSGVNMTATTGADGSYSFAVTAAGTYTLTPSFNLFTFNPGSQTITKVSVNETGVNFSGQPIMYTISGQVLIGNGLSHGPPCGITTCPLVNVTLTLTGTNSAGAPLPQLNAITQADGSFTLSAPAGGNYTLTPSLAGYSFNPYPSPTFANLSGNQPGIIFYADQHLLSGNFRFVSQGPAAAVKLTNTPDPGQQYHYEPSVISSTSGSAVYYCGLGSPGVSDQPKGDVIYALNDPTPVLARSYDSYGNTVYNDFHLACDPSIIQIPALSQFALYYECVRPVFQAINSICVAFSSDGVAFSKWSGYGSFPPTDLGSSVNPVPIVYVDPTPFASLPPDKQPFGASAPSAVALPGENGSSPNSTSIVWLYYDQDVIDATHNASGMYIQSTADGKTYSPPTYTNVQAAMQIKYYRGPAAPNGIFIGVTTYEGRAYFNWSIDGVNWDWNNPALLTEGGPHYMGWSGGQLALSPGAQTLCVAPGRPTLAADGYGWIYSLDSVQLYEGEGYLGDGDITFVPWHNAGCYNPNLENGLMRGSTWDLYQINAKFTGNSSVN